jgi:hypothetical protein
MLPEDEQSGTAAQLLAALGATHDSLRIASLVAARPPYGPRLLWRRSMRGVLNDPGFPAVATRLGLMAYWKTTHTRPDVCLGKDPPPFCGMI